MKRWIIVGSVVVALALVGCSKDEPTASTPTTSASSGDAPSTTEGGGGGGGGGGGNTTDTLSLEDCLTVSVANLGVISGNADDAKKLEAFDPPSDVMDAANLIVENGGIKLDASDQDDVLGASETLTNWVDQVCPS